MPSGITGRRLGSLFGLLSSADSVRKKVRIWGRAAAGMESPTA